MTSIRFTQPPIAGARARAMTAEDEHIRAEAKVRNLNRATESYALEDVYTDTFRPYVSFDPGRGDVGIVLESEEDGTTIATLWCGFIEAQGFVAPGVPEIVANVDPQWQGKGIGGWLLAAAIDHGRTHGWPGISLFIEPDNPARRLYARHDFITQDTDGVMLRTLSPLIRAMAVYCGSSDGARPEYLEAARMLGRSLAERNITMVYGGARVGLMGACADACLEAGGEVIGVMPGSLADLELAHPGLSRLEIVDDIMQRKGRMEELADAFVALPGGMGTLEELTEVLVRQQIGPYTGPVALFNVEGYWEPLLSALRVMGEEGFIWEKYLDAIVIADDIEGLFEGYKNWANPGLKWRVGGLAKF